MDNDETKTAPSEDKASPPKRDKFASMAAKQQEQQQQQQQQQQLPNNTTNMDIEETKTAPSEDKASPPKRDKFASMAAKQEQQQQQQATAAPTIMDIVEAKTASSEDKVSAPKRDKFSSMAAKQQEQQQQTTAAPRRGKFAKLAAVKQASSTATTTTTTTTTASTADTNDDNNDEKQLQELQNRANQRRDVLQDLKQAERMTWQLLNLASSTCHALSDLDFDQEAVAKTSAEYRETLEQIHSKLHKHAHLVVPYQNHEVDTKTQKADKKDNGQMNDNMYVARVEMRLATERKEVLGEWLRLEQQDKESEAPSSTATTAVPVMGETRKRQREE